MNRLPPVLAISFGSVVAILASASGCGLHHLTGPPPGPPPPHVVVLENPLLIPVQDQDFIWNQIVDTVDNYFRIEREQRVRLVGGILTEGRIETQPLPAATYLEPWRRDSTPGFERLHSTLQTTRRQAEVRVIPAVGGYRVEVLVFKELEDLSQPEQATVGGNTLRHDGSLVRQPPTVRLGPATLGWIRLGRDITLEQRILGEIQARVTDPAH